MGDFVRISKRELKDLLYDSLKLEALEYDELDNEDTYWAYAEKIYNSYGKETKKKFKPSSPNFPWAIFEYEAEDSLKDYPGL